MGHTLEVRSDPAERLRERIRADGPIPFAAFMEEALYGAGGYYAGDELAIGEDGDFVTGSSHSPLFGRTTAELLTGLDRELGKPADYLEVGFGTGAHLEAVMESSVGSRRWLACDRVLRNLPVGIQASDSLSAWPARSIEGLIFSYELLDALPVHRLKQVEVASRRELRELHVGLDGERFVWLELALSDPSLAGLVPDRLERGQVADVAKWARVYRELTARLGRGLVVTFDYGFEREKLFDPRVRMNGTLACYRRQRVHRDPFADVGDQDLTAHVDFTALIEAGEGEGLETVALTRQAPWLAALGILDGTADRPPAERLEAMALLDLDGMGEDIRVLVQGRDVDAARLVDLSLL